MTPDALPMLPSRALWAWLRTWWKHWRGPCHHIGWTPLDCPCQKDADR